MHVPTPAYAAPVAGDASSRGCGHRPWAVDSPVCLSGPVGAAANDAVPGINNRAIAEEFVSVTPLQMELTAYGMMEALANWLGK